MTRLSKKNRKSAQLLSPGGGVCRDVFMDVDGSERRRLAYELLLSISSAIRDRADDHSLSTERGDVSMASAVESPGSSPPVTRTRQAPAAE